MTGPLVEAVYLTVRFPYGNDYFNNYVNRKKYSETNMVRTHTDGSKYTRIKIGSYCSTNAASNDICRILLCSTSTVGFTK